MRIEAGRLTYANSDESKDTRRQVELQQGLWFASVPVMRGFYEAFAAEVDLMEDGERRDDLRHSRLAPESWRTSPLEPAIGIRYGSAVSFCNWLSRREGLRPVYRFEANREVPPLMGFRPGPKAVNSWVADPAADGYRLPTFAEFEYVARCGYERGRPWLVAKTLAERGGDYVSPSTTEYSRQLFTLMPNRFGCFVNDDHCGGWIGGHNYFRDATLRREGVDPTTSGELPSFSHGIYLARTLGD